MEEIFEKIYKDLEKECEKGLKELNNKKRKIIITILIILIVINLVLSFIIKTGSIILLMVMISVVILVFFILYGNKLYRDAYKNEVIRRLVNLYNNKMYFDSKYGVIKSFYKASNFDKRFTDYNSEDRIFGKLEGENNFQMSEVLAEEVHTYKSNGNTHTDRNETFSGLFGTIKLSKNLMTQINVFNDSHVQRYAKDRIEVDSAEFEEFYDLLAKDKILALKIFTPELIEKFNELRRENPKYIFELKICEENVYFRFKCGHNLFEPLALKNNLDKQQIKKYFKLIYYPIELSRQLIKNINNVII